MPTLALLGDSILDNRPYVGLQADTMGRLRDLLGPTWTVDLLARDGSTIDDVWLQLRRLANNVDHAVLSAGGNDALYHIGLLSQPARAAAEVLDALDGIAQDFATRYRALLAEMRPRVGRLVVCTIYEPPLADPVTARLARVPLSLLNDQIVRAAARFGSDVLDLRTVCTHPADFVQEIEPSGAGAERIAHAVHRAVLASPGPSPVRLFAP